MINFQRARQIKPEIIKQLLKNRYNADVFYENDNYIVFPTICHNVSGGSNKLYYYKDSYIFRCYTECNACYDIFGLIRKAEETRGQDLSIYECLHICGVETGNVFKREIEHDYAADIAQLESSVRGTPALIPLRTFDSSVLGDLVWSEKLLLPWIEEGISVDTLQKFNILFDMRQNCIVIPNYHINGELIGVRGRFLSPTAKAKYMPLFINKKSMAHPSSLSLYGLLQNKATIMRSRRAIIFEGEKSVLKMDTIYGDDSIAVAVLGKNISTQQILLLHQMGVEEVVIAFDADYRNDEEIEKVAQEYVDAAKALSPFFVVSIIIDYDHLLEYKDSPIDGGAEVFDQLLTERIYIRYD